MAKPKRDSRLGKFIFGLILTAFFVLLTASLLSHSPFDPPDSLLYTGTKTAAVENLCGRTGAWISARLFNFCGVGVWFILIACFFRLITYFYSGACRNPILKTIGFFMILAAVSGSAAFLMPNTEAGSIYGCGGWLGAMVRTELNDWFAPLGSAAFLMSLFLAGVVLACEWGLIRLVIVATGFYALSETVISLFNFLKNAKLPEKSKKENFDLKIENKEENPAENKDTQESPVSEQEPKETTPDDSPSDTKNEDVPENEGESDTDDIDFKEEETGDTADGESDTENEPDTGDASDDGDASDAGDASDNDDESDDETDSEPEPDEKQTDSDETSKPPYELPPISLLDEGIPYNYDLVEQKIRATGEKLEKAFADYGFHVQVVAMQTGPVLTLYEIALDAGTRIAQIRSLASSDDLAVAMSVQSVRIVAPLPGKNTIGVEIPNKDRQLVRLRDVMTEGAETASNMAIPLYLGQDVKGNPLIADMAKLPHLLIAGRTGTGKSVCLNSVILSILMTRSPDEVRLLLIDPKVVEFAPYKTIPHLLFPTVTDMKKAEAILGWAVNKMEERYHQLARAGVRQLSEYNRLSEAQLRARTQPESEEEWGTIPKRMPYLVIVIDEMSDMMMVAGKDAESHIIRLAQKSRAVGIHLVLATQKPTVDVITGQIKSNLPARIAFGVASLTDSRVVLDARGAEQLLGNGDMLFLLPGTSRLIRGQGTYVSNEETKTVVAEISTDTPDYDPEIFTLGNDDDVTNHPDRAAKLLQNKDKLYNEAVEYVIQEGRGSTSLLQRRFEIGYGRAARIIDTMAVEGVVGPYNGSQAREVIMTLDQWKALNEPKPETFSTPILPKTNKPAKRNHFVVEKRLPIQTEPVEEFDEELDETPEEEPIQEPEEEINEEPVEESFDESAEDLGEEQADFTEINSDEIPEEFPEEESAENYEPEEELNEPEESEDEFEEEESDEWEHAERIETVYDSPDDSRDDNTDDVVDNLDDADESSDELIPVRPKPNLREIARNRKKKKNKKNKRKKRR